MGGWGARAPPSYLPQTLISFSQWWWVEGARAPPPRPPVPKETDAGLDVAKRRSPGIKWFPLGGTVGRGEARAPLPRC